MWNVVKHKNKNLHDDQWELLDYVFCTEDITEDITLFCVFFLTWLDIGGTN